MTKETSNRCGTCTACCKIIGVEELNKPRNKWCDLCTPGKGCNAYDSRPRSCVDFECYWLQSQSSETPLAIELRPDRSNVVLVGLSDGCGVVANVDPGYPHAAAGKMMAELLASFLNADRPVIVSVGDKIKIIGDRSGKYSVRRVPPAAALDPVK